MVEGEVKGGKGGWLRGEVKGDPPFFGELFDFCFLWGYIPPPGPDTGIRSTFCRYASYWNAFLCFILSFIKMKSRNSNIYLCCSTIWCTLINTSKTFNAFFGHFKTMVLIVTARLAPALSTSNSISRKMFSVSFFFLQNKMPKF